MYKIHSHLLLKYFGFLDVRLQFFNPSYNFHKLTIHYKGLNPNIDPKKPANLKKKVILLEELKTDEEHDHFEAQVKILEKKIKDQGDLARQLKLSNTSSSTDIKEAIDNLLQLKKDLKKLSSEFNDKVSLDKTNMDDLIKRRFYFDSAFRAYGGFRGQYDYGPTGSALMDNILSEWKKHFVVRNGIMMMSGSIITPEAVFKSSGHLDRFTDFVAKDDTGEVFRLDHLMKEELEKRLNKTQLSEAEQKDMKNELEKIDNMELDELVQLMKKYEVKSPNTQKEYEDVFELNLMFQIDVSTSETKNYLKPEHAQGIVLNFKKLLEMNDSKLPFACAQVGLAFRNEASMKRKVLRVREFVLAEIEHFCYPDDKSHRKFSQVSDTKLWLLSASRQKEGRRPVFMAIGEAVNTGMVGSETLGYYLAETQKFLLNIGIEPRRVRFRQHPSNKMAHYAADCWDAEVLTSFGWVECAGCADRGTYDLSQHSKMTGRDLAVERPLKEPCEKEVLTLTIDRKLIRKAFGEDAKEVIEDLNDLSPEELQRMNDILNRDEEYILNGMKLTREMVPKLEKEKKMISSERITPCIIEPSFGIGRIFYCLLEHTFRIRNGNEFRPYFALPPSVAPFKIAVLPLFRNAKVDGIVQKLVNDLADEDVSVWVDKSKKSIGRQYIKMDELSVPFCVTIDGETLSDPFTVSLRDRETTKQVRLPISEVIPTIKEVSKGKLTWKCLLQKWPIFSSKDEWS